MYYWLHNQKGSARVVKTVVIGLVIIGMLIGSVVGWNKNWAQKIFDLFFGQPVMAVTSPISVVEFNEQNNPDEFYLKQYQLSDINYQGKFVMEAQVIDKEWVKWILTEDSDNYYYYNRSQQGIQKIIINKQDKKSEVWEQAYEQGQKEFQLKVNSEIKFEIFNDGNWRELVLNKIGFSRLVDNQIVQQGMLVIDSQNFIFNTYFDLNTKKWTWTVKNNGGALIRAYWQTDVQNQEATIEKQGENKESYIKQDNLTIDWSDFGDIENTKIVTEGNIHKVYFYPEGMIRDLVIDPYLSVTDSASTITVDTATFKLVWTASESGQITEWYDKEGSSPSTNLADGYYKFEVLELNDTADTFEVVEKGPSRVVIHTINTNISDSSGTYDRESYYYVYSNGKIFVDRKINITADMNSDYLGPMTGIAIEDYPNWSRAADNYETITGHIQPFLDNNRWYTTYREGYGAVFWGIIDSNMTIMDGYSSSLKHRLIHSDQTIYGYDAFSSAYHDWSAGEQFWFKMVYDLKPTDDLSAVTEDVGDKLMRRYMYTDDLFMYAGDGNTMSDGEVTQGFNADGSYHVSSRQTAFDPEDEDVTLHFAMDNYSTGSRPEKGKGTFTINNQAHFVKGKIGNALDLRDHYDGIISYALKPGEIDYDKGSVSVWVKQFTGLKSIFQIGTGGTSISIWAETSGSDVKIRANYMDTYQSSDYNYTRGEWLHIRYTWDRLNSGEVNLYVNGKLIDTDDISNVSAPTGSTLTMGNDGGSSADVTALMLDEFYLSKDPDQPYAQNRVKLDMHAGQDGIAQYVNTSLDYANKDSVLFYWNMENPDNISANKGGGTISNLGSPTAVIGKQDYGIQIGNSDHLFVTMDNNLNGAKGRIGFWVKPETANDFNFLNDNTESDANSISISYSASTDHITFKIRDNANTLHEIQSVADELIAGQWYYLEFAWDDANGYQKIYRDGEVMGNYYESNQSDWSSNRYTPTDNLDIGDHFDTQSGTYVIDEFYISNDPDEKFVGGNDTKLGFMNDNNMLVDPNGGTQWASISDRKPYGAYDVNDSNVLFYWDMNSTTTAQYPDKGSGIIRTSQGNYNLTEKKGVAHNGIYGAGDYQNAMASSTNNINLNKGKIGFWYQPDNSDTVVTETLFNLDTSSLFSLNRLPGENLKFYYGGSDYNTDVVSWNAGSWYWIEVAWDDVNDTRKVWVNGRLVGSSSVSVTAPTGGTNIYIGSNVSGFNPVLGTIDEFYISSNPDQKNIPSFYDVFSYTDKHDTYLSGIPTAGVGSIKWNYSSSSAVIAQPKRDKPAVTIHDWYPRTTLTPVLDLPLDGAGGTNSTQVYNATSSSWIGEANYTTTFETGKDNKGAKINEAGEAIFIPESGLIKAKGTVEFWYKNTDTPHAWGRFFRYSDNEGSGSDTFTFNRQNSDTTLRFNVGGTDWQPSGLTNVFDGSWHKLKVVWDADNNYKAIFIDDVREAFTTTAFSAPSLSSTELIGIGNYGYDSDTAYAYIGGIIDDFRIYDEVIEGEIRDEGYYPDNKTYVEDNVLLDLSFDHPTSSPYSVFDEHSKQRVGEISSGVEFVDGVRGLGAQFDNDGEEVSGIDMSQMAISTSTGLTIEFDYKMSSTTANDYAMFFSHSKYINNFRMYRINGGTDIRLRLGNGEVNFGYNNNLDQNVFDGNWHHIKVIVDWATDWAKIWIDGHTKTDLDYETTLTADDIMPDFSSGTLYIGEDASDPTMSASGIIDNFRLYNSVYRDYGAYDSENNDVLFYWNADSAVNGQTPQKGSGLVHVINATASTTAVINKGIEFNANGEYMTASSTSNIDASKGRLGFWYIPNTADVSSDKYLINFGDSNDRLHIRRESNETLVFYYGNPYYAANSAALTWVAGTPYFIEASWDSVNNKLYLYRNGTLVASDSNTQTTPTLQASMVFGNYGIGVPNYPADGVIDEIYITSDPNTPINPTMNYKPIKMPHLAVGTGNSENELEFGNGQAYNVAALNDIGSYLVQYNQEMSQDTTMNFNDNFGTDGLGDATPVAPVRLMRGIRLKKGVRLK